MKERIWILMVAVTLVFININVSADEHEGHHTQRAEEKAKPHSHPTDKGTAPAAPPNEHATDKNLNINKEQEKKHNHQRDSK